MKKISALLGIIMMGTMIQAQEPLITITRDKTTSLVFPYPIRHVDRGKPQVLVQQVREADNLLMVKAATDQLPETNLSVLIADGKLYNLTVRYDSAPKQLVYHLGGEEIFFRGASMNEADLSAYATMLLDNGTRLRGLSSSAGEMTLRLQGIYTKDNVLFFQFFVNNQSAIDYKVGYLRLYIEDSKKKNRTAGQQRELVPLKISGNHSLIKGMRQASIVLALPRFTMPGTQYLGVEMGEKNGGRQLRLKIRSHKLVKAILLPDINLQEKVIE